MLLSDWTLPGLAQDLTIDQGRLDLAGHALSVANQLVLNPGGALELHGGSYSPNVAPRFVDNGGTIVP
ncbi:MAG: hypothetical protein QM765_11035 [Myxococcales bacterium]